MTRKSRSGEPRKSKAGDSHKPPARKSADGDRLTIERLGGLGGFGMAGSRIRSEGEVSMAALSHADCAALDALFERPPASTPRKSDSFVYRLTRRVGAEPQTIEVAEDHVPVAVRNCVKDRLA